MSIVKVKSWTMVRPATETPSHALWLSRLDMLGSPYGHNTGLLVYRYRKTDNTNMFFDTNILKEALSRVLVPFYPMAGRLRINEKDGRHEIDCNAEGAVFVEAEADMCLDVSKDVRNELTSPESEVGKELFPTVDYSQGLSSFPLLLLQVTRFKCGGVCVGLVQHHHVADASSHLHFVDEWGRVARGLDLLAQPVHDRAKYLAPRHPPLVNFRHLEFEPSFPPLIPKDSSGEKEEEIEHVFNISKEQTEALKVEVRCSEGAVNCKPSTFSTLAGHVWRSACKARGLADDQDVKLIIPTNGRPRFKEPAMPQAYCGNVMFFSVCVEKAGDVMKKPLWYAASKIHEAVRKMDDQEYLRSAIDYLESHPNHQQLIKILRGPHTFVCPNLSVNSLARVQSYDFDFGWGKPEFLSPTRIKSEGKASITSGLDGDGSFSLVIKLFKPHMELFKNYLYDEM